MTCSKKKKNLILSWESHLPIPPSTHVWEVVDPSAFTTFSWIVPFFSLIDSCASNYERSDAHGHKYIQIGNEVQMSNRLTFISNPLLFLKKKKI